MQFKKLAAIAGSALLGALAIAGPVAASTVTSVASINSMASASNFPIFVVGASAQTADVAGAINIAVGMASAVGGGGGVTTGGDGLQKNNIDINYGNLTDSGNFPNPMKSFHFSNLKTGTIAWKGNNYNYHEQLWLNNTYFSHDFSTSGINGTETMVVPGNQIAYDYAFDQSINLSSATTAGTTGTLTSPEYTYPIKVTLLGKPFIIVGIGSNQVKMLSGSVGTADATTPVVFGSYSVYATQGQGGASAWVKVVVKDSTGSTVDTLIIDSGNTKDSTVANLTIKVTAVRALTDGTVVGADLVVGPTNAVEKTYTTSCDITSTGTSDTKFPGETEWCIQLSGFATAGYVNTTTGDKLTVIYRPTSQKYIKMTDASPQLNLPNSMGAIYLQGWNYNTFATLTFLPVTGKSVYNTTGSIFATDLSGIEISSDTVGTLFDQYGTNTGYSKAYILFNYSLNTTHGPVMLGYYSTVNSRIEIPSTTYSGQGTGYLRYVDIYNDTLVGGIINATNFNITVSYGGGAAVTDQQFIFANITNFVNATTVNGVTGGGSIFKTFQLGTGTYPSAVRLNFINKTSSTSWSTTSAPQFRLYTDDASNQYDVQALSTAAGGGQNTAAIGVSTQDVVTDSGAIVVSPSSNSGGQQVVVKVPAQTLKVKSFVGKPGIGTTTTTSAPTITSDIVRLDSEVTDADKAGKDLVLVGGPCVNTLVAALKTAAKFPYGCTDWPGRNFGRIQLISGGFTSGYTVLVVAGTRAADTDQAARIVQTGTALSGITGAAAEVSETGTVSAAT
jgi:hypothetical protein